MSALAFALGALAGGVAGVMGARLVGLHRERALIRDRIRLIDEDLARGPRRVTCERCELVLRALDGATA